MPAQLMSLDTADRFALARTRLVEANGIDLAHLEGALSRAMRPRDEQADVFLQYRSSEGWSLENGVVKRVNMSIDEGFGLRTVCGDSTAFAFSESIDSASLNHAARSVASMEAGEQAIDAKRATAVERSNAASTTGSFENRYLSDDPIASLGPEHKLALLHRLDRLTRGVDDCVVRVFASLSASHEWMLVMDETLRTSADVRPQSSLHLRVVVERAGRTESASSGIGGRYGVDRFDEAALDALARRVVSTALAKLDAGAAPSGELTVVLAPGWPGILLHEAVGHGLEADFIQRGSSVFSGKFGEQVTAPRITIVDDGTLHEARGSLSLDDEGHPGENTVLIENGVLRGFMQDRKSARLTGARQTGNGRRESFARLPMPRMTNTYMRNGAHEPGEIVESVKNGLYVRDLSDGQVDIVSGNFVFNASLAYLIENGRITRPVSGATLTGNGLQTLRKVSMIGNDLALDPGIAVCGKAGQAVPVCVGQPTLRIDGITVGGTR